MGKLDLTIVRKNISRHRSPDLEYRLKKIREELGEKIFTTFVQRNKFDYKLYAYARENLCNAKIISETDNSPIEKPIIIESERKAKITKSKLLDYATDKPVIIARPGQRVIVTIYTKTKCIIKNPIIGLSVRDSRQNLIFEMNNLQAEIEISQLKLDKQNVYEFMFSIPQLNGGIYTITLALAEGNQDKHITICEQLDAIIFLVPILRTIPSSGIIDILEYTITSNTQS